MFWEVLAKTKSWILHWPKFSVLIVIALVTIVTWYALTPYKMRWDLYPSTPSSIAWSEVEPLFQNGEIVYLSQTDDQIGIYTADFRYLVAVEPKGNDAFNLRRRYDPNHRIEFSIGCR